MIWKGKAAKRQPEGVVDSREGFLRTEEVLSTSVLLRILRQKCNSYTLLKKEEKNEIKKC